MATVKGSGEGAAVMRREAGEKREEIDRCDTLCVCICVCGWLVCDEAEVIHNSVARCDFVSSSCDWKSQDFITND